MYKRNTKSCLRRCILCNKIVCFFSTVFFPALIFCLFLLKCSHALTNYILKHRNDTVKKTKLPMLYICLKLPIKTPRGLLKVVQIESIWRFFCVRIDNLEQVQLTLACLSPLLSIICIWNVSIFSALFLWNKYFTFVDLLTLFFYCILIAANMEEFKGTER